MPSCCYKAARASPRARLLLSGATNESKKLAMALNIKALPTFHLYRNSKQIDSMTGAKVWPPVALL